MTEPEPDQGIWHLEVTDECVSSMQCIMTAPDLFALDDEGFSTALRARVDGGRIQDLQMAVDGCPVGAVRISRG